LLDVFDVSTSRPGQPGRPGGVVDGLKPGMMVDLGNGPAAGACHQSVQSVRAQFN
jgi:hypothetical protein